MLDKTMIFSLGEERDDAIKRSLTMFMTLSDKRAITQ